MRDLLPKKWRQDMEQPVSSLQHEMNKLFENFFGMEAPFSAGEWRPRIDVSESDQNVVVKAEVPGMDKSDIDVTLTGDVLTIKGEKKDERKESEGNYRLLERRYGSFRRSIPLPQGIDADNTNAEFNNGVLTITLPKTEESRSRKIAISESEEQQ